MPSARLLAPLAVLASCSVFDPDPLPPHGETLVVVDTDLPVPQVVSRLRIDVFAEDGRWIAHRDDVRPDPRDWPASFSVYSDDPSRERGVRVRLRAYLDARTVPYRGSERLEGFETPELEPDPALSVDRTVDLRLTAGIRGRVRVLLRGACVGRAPCDADEEPALEPTLARNVPSAVGTFGAEPCTGPEDERRACIPGGAFVLGDAFYRADAASTLDTRPERIVRLSRFLIDREEVSVGRFRDAIARGFMAPSPPTANETDRPPGEDVFESCTWSEAPRGREAYPLSCVSWESASSFCRFDGGELPTEAQWEYAALSAGRTRKATYSWGDEAPSCERAVYARAPASDGCITLGSGPATASADGDTTPLGVRHLAGNLEELVRDDVASYGDPCWTDAAPVDPWCQRTATTEPRRHSVRGGSWFSRGDDLRGVARLPGVRRDTKHSMLGFRCVYPAR